MPSVPMFLNLFDDVQRFPPVPAVPFYTQSGGRLYRWPSCTNLNRVGRYLENNKSVCPIGENGFQVCMDVAHFRPSELNVKVVDNFVIVEAKHEEREDNHGYISRHFIRRYALPKGYDAAKVKSTLSSDGVLTVSVPKPQSQDQPDERVIQIHQTGPAHLNVKENIEDVEKSVNDAANTNNTK